MVDDVGQHGQNHVANGRRTQALKRDAHANRHDLAVAQEGDDAANDAHDHARDAHALLTKLVAQRNDKEDGGGHRKRAQDAQHGLRSAPRVGGAKEGVVQNPLAEVRHRAVLDGAAPLIQQVDAHDDPPLGLAGDGAKLRVQRRRVGLFVACGRASRVAAGQKLLGNALAGKAVLQVDGKGGEKGHHQHGQKPQVLVLLQGKRDQHGEDHRARAHDAKAGDVGKRRQRAALLAVTRRDGDQRGVGRVVDGVGHGVVQVVRDGDPHHLGHALKRHEEHEDRGNRESQGRQQDPGAGLAGQAVRALDELAHHQVGDDDQNRGEELQGGQERQVKLKHVGEVVLQLAGEDARCEKTAKGANQVAKEHLGGGNFVFLGEGRSKRALPERAVCGGGAHSNVSFLRAMLGIALSIGLCRGKVLPKNCQRRKKFCQRHDFAAELQNGAGRGA